MGPVSKWLAPFSWTFVKGRSHRCNSRRPKKSISIQTPPISALNKCPSSLPIQYWPTPPEGLCIAHDGSGWEVVGSRQLEKPPTVRLAAQLTAFCQDIPPSVVLAPSSKADPAPKLASPNQVIFRSSSYINRTVAPPGMPSASCRPLSRNANANGIGGRGGMTVIVTSALALSSPSSPVRRNTYVPVALKLAVV